MSNEKSRRLGRRAGSHAGLYPTVSRLRIDGVADREFIRRACRSVSEEAIASEFSEVLVAYRRDPRVVDAIGLRVSLGKREVVKNLTRLESRYGNVAELRELFGLLW